MFTINQVADAAGIKPETVRHYHKQATRARKNGTSRASDLPAPIGVRHQANVWDTQEILDWVAARNKPSRMGAIPKKEMQAVLNAAQAGKLFEVITIAKRNLS